MQLKPLQIFYKSRASSQDVSTFIDTFFLFHLKSLMVEARKLLLPSF